MEQCPVDRALSRCPFLHNLCEREGRAYAASFALNPLAPAGSNSRELRRRPVLEEEQDLAATFRLFHGRDTGVFPLASLNACPVAAPASAPTSASLNTASAARCPFSSAAAEPPVAPLTSLAQPKPSRAAMGNPLAGAPLATLSLGMPDFGEFLRRLQQGQPKPKPKPSTRRPPTSRPDIKPSATGSTSLSQPPSISPAPPPGPAPAPGPAAAGGGGAAASGALCPLRKWLGPYAGIVFNKAGNLQCPEPIVRARAALAQTQTVRALRPQVLPVKLIAVGAIAAAANVPCGMWREHTDKFSAQWFLAVHATIPFVAMLRNAVIMPKLAIVCTIAAAIAGQAMGARIERERLRRAAEAASESEAGGAAARLLRPGVDVAVAAAALAPAPKRVKAFRTRPAGHVVSSSSIRVAADVPVTTALGRLMEGDPAEWRMEAGRKGARSRAVTSSRQLLALPPVVAAH